ncbi:UDP-N-acetylmuramate--L-alanine ligase [Treponema sp.]|uniref:UDP-N-acetylmuramate--L-alanine ligase n=1 Tax=Treponema sp. TaxID=166 RepID=UPI00298EAC83|nr:Mur ligase domain-containing protein [Treponema sp.]MCR5613756.1 UDP-N-acetylmuramate--L-alanine ligase [Treponema sp.]
MTTQLPENLKGVHIHFVGIKGTGMAALVEILFHAGAVITGSDVSERFYTDEILEKLGLKALPFAESNITDEIEYVVYSSAYKLDKNPDLIAACKKNIPCLLYTQALGSYSERSYSCGICGVHGKTSTTGLTGTILKELDLPVQVLAGSVINSFGGTCTYTSPLVKKSGVNSNSAGSSCFDAAQGSSAPSGANDAGADKAGTFSNKNIFVAETCEYQRHFMSFCPQKIILTSVESDHQDYYPTYEDIRDAFVDYICKLPQGGQLIYCADDKGAVETANIASKKRSDIKLIPYGQKAEGDYKLTFGKVENEKNNFELELFKSAASCCCGSVKNSGTLAISVPGKHEVMDAAAATALCCELLRDAGLAPIDNYERISQGLLNFTGGKRRSEIVGRFKTQSGNDVVVIDDYGHHPTAVKTTLEGFREFYKGRKIIVDFMSHTYSRTQALLKEFASCFTSADEVILHKIYSSARENPKDFTITGRTLYDEVIKSGFDSQKVHYFEEIFDAKDFVLRLLDESLSPEYPDGYLFVTMGAGDNWKLGKALV